MPTRRCGRCLCLLSLSFVLGWGVAWRLAAAEIAPAASGRVVYVNNVTGNDDFDGLRAEPGGDGKAGPFASIAKAFAAARTSDRIEIANTGTPYRGGNTLMAAGGTAEQPLVINGNGALISGLDRVPKEKWTPVREGILATEFWPMSNMLKGYTPIQYWIGTPQIWWLDGKPAPNCISEDELNRTEGGFYWNKPLKQLWVHLSAGKALDDVVIQIPVHGTSLCINTDFVTVCDLRAMLSWNDGFDTHGAGKNIVYQRCIATDNCGQGFSVHDTTTALYEDCLAERNASSGACDVNECFSLYRRCVFVNNSFEAGVYATESSRHVYESCLIVGNQPFEQVWQKNFSGMTFVNCVIAGSREGKPGLVLLENGAAHLRECTLVDAPFVCRVNEKLCGSLFIQNCVLARCTEPFLSIPAGAGARVRLAGNVYFAGPGVQFGDRVFAEADWADYQNLSKLDQDSTWLDPKFEGTLDAILGADSPVLALRKAKPSKRVGAVLPAAVWDLYAKTRGDAATPTGIVRAPAP